MHGHVTINDVSVLAFHFEGIEDPITDGLVESQFEIITFFFFERLDIFEEIAFEGCHLRFVEKG